jgi:acetolactate synthase-1/2/3 large subunit
VLYPIAGDANDFLKRFIDADLQSRPEWLAYAREIRDALPVIESANQTAEGYLSPFVFASELSDLCACDDIIIPCSSGGAFTTMMQAFRQKAGQTIITNKGLASMGYGLSGAIGAAFANPHKRVILVEGDGGFSQNLQEIGTAALNRLNIKIFIFDDSGYASIRMTQRNYFGGRYVGCDIVTGLGLPNWDRLFSAWDVPSLRITTGFPADQNFLDLLAAPGTAAFIVSIDPQQTYLPKIMSRMTAGGAMESAPLHLMSPDLSEEQKARYLKFI